MSFVQSEDGTHKGVVERLVKVMWTKARSWHGEKVWVRVRSENVADGVKVEVSVHVWPRDVLVDTLPELTLANSAADHEYTIDWKAKDMLELDDRLFVLKAKLKLDAEITSETSAPIHVDRELPVFSL